MRFSKRSVMTGLAAIPTGLVVGIEPSRSALSQGDVIGELASGEGIFVDGKTFKIAKGKGKGEPSAQIARLGAKEVGPGAIIFRYREKLYMVEGTPLVANVQAMKAFQDDWNASYMNSVKDFQDNWDTSYMK
jgi:predicted aconitase with swiveling domain